MGEGDHPAVAGPTCRIKVVRVHHPGSDGPEQPDVAFARFLDTFEPQVHYDVRADLAMQRDDGGDVLEIEDVDRFATDLTEHHIASGYIADRGHHATLPAIDDLAGLLLVVETMRARPRLTATAEPAAAADVDIQQYGRTDEAQCGQREPERDHYRLA